jgi:hypothetical protein
VGADPSCVGADAFLEEALVPSLDQTVVDHEIWDHEALQSEEGVDLWMVVPLDHNPVHEILVVHVLVEDLLVVQSHEVPLVLYFLYRKRERHITYPNRKLCFLTKLSEGKYACSTTRNLCNDINIYTQPLLYAPAAVLKKLE